MPAPTLTPGNDQQDKERNIAQQKSDDLVNRLSRAEQGGSMEQQPGSTDVSDFERNYGENADSTQEDANIERMRQREAEGTQNPGWRTDVSKPQETRKNKFVGFVTRNKGKLGVGGGVAGGLIALIVSLSGLLGLPSLGNMMMQNDPSTRAIQSRVLKPLSNMTSEPDAACEGAKVKTFACKNKRISHKGLALLEKAGITAYDSSGKKIELQKSGYPDKNPSSYKVELDGVTLDKKPNELGSFIDGNSKLKGKLVGTGGVFNPSFKNWSSKYLTEKLLKPAGVNKNGGVADGENKKMTAEERNKALKEKISKVIPGFDKLSGGSSETLADKISKSTGAKVEKQLERAKKGGVGYLAGVSTCVGVKLPMYFAAGYAAVQIAQVLPIVNELVLSPASKAMAAGGDKNVKFTAEDNEFVMSALTDRYPDKDGKMSSALDSDILKASIESNTGKPEVSKDFAPGYAAIVSPLVIGSVAASASMAPYCNSIMSPAAMYSAMAVDAATTIAASTTVVGGIVKFFGSWAISEIAVKAGAALAGAAASALITELATNKDIPSAKGKDLGDLIGTSLYTFKSSAAAARHVGVVREADLPEINKQNAQTDASQREMDIASLSPFDVSSKYTFLGSIASRFSSALVSNGGYQPGIFNNFLAVAKMPFMGSSVSAAPVQSYASEFGLTAYGRTENDKNTPCITVAGTPCYGLTAQQASTSTNDAIAALQNEGWIDDSKPINNDSATISDLVSGGQIKADTPLADFIATCSDLTTGDYIINAGACTTTSSTSNPSSIKGDGLCVSTGDKKESCPSDIAGGTPVEGLKDARSLAAMTPALLDYQIAQSFNGFDDPDSSQDKTSGPLGAYVLPVDPGYQTPDQDQDWGVRDICGGDANSFCKFHRGFDFAFGGQGQPVYSIADGEVVETAFGNPACSQTTSGQISMDNRVLIRHADGTTSGYSHMTIASVQAEGIKVGTKVKAGQKIGAISDCGNVQGAHLHFTINPGDATDPRILAIDSNNRGETYIDPAAYMALYGVDLMTGKYTDGR